MKSFAILCFPFAGSEYQVPIARLESEQRVFASGDNIELRCDVTGYPQPQVEWTYRRGPLPSNTVAENGVLRIRRVDRDNEGEYQCTASNSVGRSLATMTLTLDQR